jgi:hypothetical protein
MHKYQEAPLKFSVISTPERQQTPNLWFIRREIQGPRFSVSWTSRGLNVNTNRERRERERRGAYEIYCAALPLTPFI